jgi:hypothetical protein
MFKITYENPGFNEGAVYCDIITDPDAVSLLMALLEGRCADDLKIREIVPSATPLATAWYCPGLKTIMPLGDPRDNLNLSIQVAYPDLTANQAKEVMKLMLEYCHDEADVAELASMSAEELHRTCHFFLKQKKLGYVLAHESDIKTAKQKTDDWITEEIADLNAKVIEAEVAELRAENEEIDKKSAVLSGEGEAALAGVTPEAVEPSAEPLRVG